MTSSLIKKFACKDANASFYFINFEGIKSNFGVSMHDLGDFYQEYCNTIDEDENNRFHIAEVLDKKTSPLTSTLFFKFHDCDEDDKSQINAPNEFIHAIAYSYQKTMSEVYQISPEMREYITAVLVTPLWDKKSISCFKIELRFPYCHVNRSTQDTLFKPAVISNLRKSNVLSLLKIQPVGDWPDIIESAKDYMFLYKSTQTSDSPNHDLRVILKRLNSPQDDNAEIDLESVFSMNDHTLIHNQDIKVNMSDDTAYATLFLNSTYWSGITSPKTKMRDEKCSYVQHFDEDVNNLEPFSLAKLFIEMMSEKTVSTENYVLDIGRVLYNITSGSDDGLLYFTEICCKNTSKINILKTSTPVETKTEAFDLESYKLPVQEEKPCYNVSICKNLWRKFKGNFLTIKTLAEMARNDNKIEYDLWHSNWVKPAIEIVLDEYSDVDIAEVLYRMFWLDFICSDLKSNKWYYFKPDNHKLVSMDSAYYLSKGIDDKLIPLLLQTRIEYSRRQNDLGVSKTTNEERKRYELKITQITSLVKKLKSHNSRERIIKTCKTNFYIENFKKLTNKGGLVTAWTNCVVEICNNRAIVRPGKLEDFLIKSGAVPYNTSYTWQHPAVLDCVKYLSQVFPDPELLHYALKDFSSYLKGKNSEKYFRVWVGSMGDNSKSMLVKLMQLWLGELCIDLPVSVYTGSSSKGGPSPELAQADGAHLAITAEPDDGDDLKSGAIKRSTGGDRFFGRMCNENGGSIDLIYKTIYMCNAVPTVLNIDGPGIKRFAFLIFLSRWVYDAPEDPVEQMKQRRFKRDDFFEQCLPEMAEAMFWVAVNYFHNYIKEGLVQPNIIQEYTRKHWEENDTFQVFILENLRRVDVKEGERATDSNSFIAGDAYARFNRFFRQQYPQSDIPKMPQFKNHMCARLGPQVNRRWLGWVIADQ